MPTPLADNPQGRLQYRQYLDWVNANAQEKEKLGFEEITRGWAKGSNEFKKELLEQIENSKLVATREADGLELKEIVWQRSLQQFLQVLGKDETSLENSPKENVWKIAIALYLRERHMVANASITNQLHIGAVSSVQSWVSRHRRDPDSEAKRLLPKLKNHETLD